MKHDGLAANGNAKDSSVSDVWLKTSYTTTMLFSACLLFLVQPLFARMSLPLLGGTPAVWAIAMCFFQAVLLAGYGYAHLLRLYATPLQSVIIHSLMLFAASMMLPFDAPSSAEPINGVAAGLTLFLLYIKAIGFPFFALSATAPLLQSWFARTGHAQASNPYFLYAASNIGSIGALFVYPILLEPILGLSSQVGIWTVCFSLLVVAITVCGFQLLRSVEAMPVASDAAGSSVPITSGRKMYWVVMAFVPSALLVAWTNYITADITSAPFLWLPPLVLFLLTFVLEFRDRPMIPWKVLVIAQAITLPITVLFQFGLSAGLVVPVLMSSATCFFASALICHRQLYNSRPSSQQLTEFYMLMSLGGVLGGLFVSIIAPVLFTTTLEYPLLLIVAMMLRASPGTESQIAEFPFNRRYLLEVAAICAAFAMGLWLLASEYFLNTIEVAVLATIPLALFRANLMKTAAFAIVALPLLYGIGRLGEVATFRNYFGVLGVSDSNNDQYRLLRHGTTIHGAQFRNEVAASFSGQPQPLTYYTRSGGIARALVAKQDQLKFLGQAGNFGLVGLGSGALSCYKNANETWTFYEIDPEVIRVAKDPRYFSYLAKCGADIAMVEGDARLTLQKTDAEKFDYLLIDAFSSDSIPSHLLTVEAIQLYQNHLKSDGVLVFHLSNRFMQLVPFVVATVDAAKTGMANRRVYDQQHGDEISASTSETMIFSKDQALLAMIDRKTGGKSEILPDGTVPWTDDFTNAPAAIWRQIFHPKRGDWVK